MRGIGLPPRALIAAPWLFGVIGLVVVTAVGSRLGANVGVAACAYLIVVALLSLLDNLVAAVLFSVAAAACLVYFFAPPFFSLRTENWSDAVPTISFLTAAIVIATLLDRARGRASAAANAQQALQAVLDEKHAVEASLRRSEDYLAQAQQLSRTGSFVWAPSSGDIQWSDEGYRIFGIDPAIKPTVDMVLQRVHPEDRELVRAAIEETSHGEKNFDVKHRIVTSDGSIKYVYALSRAVRDAAGNLEVVGAITDVTERERLEQGLRLSEGRYRYIFDFVPVALWHVVSDDTLAFLQDLRKRGVVDLDRYFDENPDAVYRAMEGTRLIECNQRTVQLFGARDAHDMQGPVSRFWKNSAENYRKLLVARFNGQEAYQVETPLTTFDGRTVEGLYFYMAFPPSLNAPGVSLAGFLDETDRLRMQSRLAAIVSSSDDAIIGKSLDGIVTSWNAGAANVFGYQAQEMIGQSIVRVIPPELQSEELEILQRIRAGERIKNYETKRVAKDGKHIDISLTISPVLDHVGNVVGASKVARDITAERRAAAELRQVQAELVRVARVTTLGELTATIAHEVNQPLAGVVSSGNACLRWLSNEPPDIAAARKSVERVISAGERAAEVIKRVRALVEKTPPQREQLNINDAIAEVLSLMAGEIQRHSIALRTELADGAPVVRGDRIQLQQVILNLILNAVDAMRGVPARRDLVVSSTPREPDGVLVTVRDSGAGLDEASMDRLFEPFFTTKAEGMGIGLAVSRTIIQSHGGELWAERNTPRGAIFAFTVPADGEQVS
jgi:PAS domain S-box-containing protein